MTNVLQDDMLDWLIDAKDANDNIYDDFIVARRVMQIAFASVTTTSTFTLHMIFDIAGHADIR